MSTSSTKREPQQRDSPFGDRVRRWREEAIRRATSDLLIEMGCSGLTMAEIARRVGIARGSLYLDTSDRTYLVAEVLDSWVRETVGVRSRADTEQVSASGVCEVLFTAAPVVSGNPRPAIPCCLRSTPCPHDWSQRWEQVARNVGLGTGPIAMLLGEAIQALASTGPVRELVDRGRFEEAGEVVGRLLDALSTEDDE